MELEQIGNRSFHVYSKVTSKYKSNSNCPFFKVFSLLILYKIIYYYIFKIVFFPFKLQSV